MDSREWYLKQSKPKWSPPSWLFGPVWSVLYILIFISFGFVFYVFFQPNKGEINPITFYIVLPFILNLIFNFLFSPIQFKLRNNLLSSIDIFLMLVTLIWLMVVIYPFYSWITFINILYLVWVLFAFVLQVEITRRNWGKR
jgi:tryptophan-rich sensory protein